VSKSRELGVKKSSGEFIAFLDADDVFLTNKLSSQIAVFDKYKEVVLVHSKVKLVNETKLKFDNDFEFYYKDLLYDNCLSDKFLKQNHICNSTVMVRSKELTEIKFGFNQIFQYEDWLLWILLSYKGKFYYQNKSLVEYRLHETSATASILKNELIAHYSRLELLLNLYSITEDIILKQNLHKLIIDCFDKLLGIYSSRVQGNTVKDIKSIFKKENLIDKLKLLENENRYLKQKLAWYDKSIKDRLIVKIKRILK
jgi:glycosyltransferase involved in cell wall biosynthesis